MTVRLTEVLWLTDPDVPFIVTAEVPTGVAAPVLMLREEVAGDAPGVTKLGSKAQLAPVGKLTPSQVRVTALLKSLTAVTVTV